MTLKEADRLSVAKRIESKKLSLESGARELGISLRQMKRIWKRYQQEGAKGLISLRKGKPSPNKTPEKLQKKALDLIKKKYADYGPTLAAEKLGEKHHLALSKETVRKWMIAEGLWKEKIRKREKVHSRRTRRSRFGELIQVDGSYEFWFEERGEKCCLIVFIDDATSKITMMRFCRTETLEDYLKVLRLHLERYGRPEAVYSDKHSIFKITRKEINEKEQWTTRFHEVLKKLDIELICAHSPQAKGRVERANGTLQDRLIKELREQGISSIEEGNKFLDGYTEKHNKKFGVEPALQEDGHRKVLRSQDLDKLCVVKDERILSKDLSFQYKKELYQIESNLVRRLQGKKVEIIESSGEIKMVLLDGKPLKYRKWKEQLAEPIKTVDTKELETMWKDKKRPKPGKHHRWRSA